jgi:hypothetical protein
MKNLRELLITMLIFVSGFIFASMSTEFSLYLMSLPNTIANIFGVIIFILTFVGVIVLGFKIFKNLNK